MPNIAIYEGGKAARMNGVSVITTDDGNGGKVEWVPQSDRQTGTLHVSENGTYRAEDEGLHSWSKVTVRLAGAPTGLEIPTLPDPVTGAEIPTGEIGLEEPVPPAGLEPIEDEPISTDEAEKILEDAGLDPSDLDPDSPNYDDAMEAIGDALGTDPDNAKVVDPENKEDVKKEQPKVEDKGQKAVGTDPNTGEPTTITPSGKEKKPTPKAIVITKLPNKLSYSDGDTIDFTGIEVKLYLSYEESGSSINAKPYRDNRYPDGTIPFSELVFPVTKAKSDSKTVDRYNEGSGFGPLEGGNGVSVPQSFGVMVPFTIDDYDPQYGGRIRVQEVNVPDGAFAVRPSTESKNRFIALTVGEPCTVSGYTFNLSAEWVSLVVDGTSYYATEVWRGSGAFFDEVTHTGLDISYLPICDWSRRDSAMRDLIRICYGGHIEAGKMEVPVEWKSPYTGDTLSREFTIGVTA